MLPEYTQEISFSPVLIAQERDIKLAALASLGACLKQNGAHIAEEKFWLSVEHFQEETDGLDTPSADGILSIPIPTGALRAVERLGFRVIEGGLKK